MRLYEFIRESRQPIDFDRWYGRAFKITDNAGDPNAEGFSIITPLNPGPWRTWKERLEFKDMVRQKLNQPGWLDDHKYNQIISSIRGEQFTPQKHIAVKERAENRSGIDVEEHEDVEDPSVIWITASAHGRELGQVKFYRQGDTVTALNLEVKPEYRGQGIAKIMYDYAKEQGYKVLRSAEQTDAGYQFWEKNRPRQGVWEDDGYYNSMSGETSDRIMQSIWQRLYPQVKLYVHDADQDQPRWSTDPRADGVHSFPQDDGFILTTRGNEISTYDDENIVSVDYAGSGQYRGVIKPYIKSCFEFQEREWQQAGRPGGEPPQRVLMLYSREGSGGVWETMAKSLGAELRDTPEH